MRLIIIGMAALLSLSVAGAWAQADSTRYINGLPVTGDDTVPNFPPTDFSPKENLVPVKARDLPPQVQAALEKGDQYAGWKDTVVYRDLNTGLFIVPVRDKDEIRIFGLSENGDPVTFDEMSRCAN